MRRSALLITASLFLLSAGVAEARSGGHSPARKPIEKPYYTGGLTTPHYSSNLKYGVVVNGGNGNKTMATISGGTFKIPAGQKVIGHPSRWDLIEGKLLATGARAIDASLRNQLNLPKGAKVKVIFLGSSGIGFRAEVTNVPMSIVAKGQYYNPPSSRAGVTFREISMSLDKK